MRQTETKQFALNCTLNLLHNLEMIPDVQKTANNPLIGFLGAVSWSSSHFQNYRSLGSHRPVTHLDSLTRVIKAHGSFSIHVLSF